MAYSRILQSDIIIITANIGISTQLAHKIIVRRILKQLATHLIASHVIREYIYLYNKVMFGGLE